MRRFVPVVAVVALLLSLLTTSPAGAAGITTHAWMALRGAELVTDPQLAALLAANLDQLEGGAQFPDSGYWNRQFNVPGGDYGEEAHWQRFFDAYIADIRADPTCGDLTEPEGPCAPRIAHLMGAMAHGMGDEVWDWLFEPTAPDHGESYIPPALAPLFGVGGIELQMDIVAISQYGRWTSPDTPPWPARTRIADIFAAVGRPDITVAGLDSGKAGMTNLRNGEASLATQFDDDILANMPWTAANMVTAPGGVEFAAVAIAAQYENTWGALLGDRPPTEVSITHPADGERDVPSTGWDRASFLPGSSPDRGGARTRVTAVLSYALPYVPLATDPSHVPAILPAGAMTLTDLSTGLPVPARPGYPRLVPYTPDPGEHTIDFQPVGNLTPCTEYRADVTSALLDAGGRPVTPESWTFRTDGCPPPPVVLPGVAWVDEGDIGEATLSVPVDLSGPSADPVTVEWTTLASPTAPPAQAEPGVDYDVSSGTVTFAPGETHAVVDVPVLGDTVDEPASEYVAVSFHDPVGGTLGGFLGLGFGGIRDDDPPELWVLPGAGSVVEGDGATATLEVAVRLSAPAAEAVTVEWATLVPGAASFPLAGAGSDYVAASGTVTFAPGDTEEVVPVTVVGDDAAEAARELVVVSFSSPSQGRMGGFWGLGFGEVLDDD